ncbi:uncharacterized protein LOC144922758 isoform X2 [Branchiostoma floridae x Branchiostoma belcheri]
MVGNIRALWRQFPVKQVAVLGVLLSIGSIGGSTIHPFLPFLTHDFFPYLKSNQIGYYAGYLTSATFIGVFLGSFMWGKLSDIVGRRPILLSSAMAILVGTMLVGFSFSFLWTVGVMFFEGLLNGTLGVSKTYLYEICPPKFHSVAFSAVWIPCAVAHFVGPSLGGFLACPATRFQTFDKPFFKQFPYLLPCAVAACAQFCILIGSCFLLDESLQKSPKDEYIDLTEMSSQDVPEDTGKRHEDSTISLLRDRLVLTPCALYALFALAAIFYWQATLNPYIASKFTYKTVFLSGVVLYAVGIILLPSMVNITGAVRSQQLLQTANSSDLTLNFTAAPTLPPVTESYIQPTTEMNATVTGQCRLAGDRRKTSQHPASELPARVWGPLLSVALLIEQGISQTYLAVIVMIGNAGVQSNRGTVNGIAQTLAALSRLVGPAVSANLFAWTTDNGLPWPLDHHLSFYLVAVLCILVVVLCASLPASSNLPRADSLTVSEEDGGREELMLEGKLDQLLDK